MIKPARIIPLCFLLATLLVGQSLCHASDGTSGASRWKITSVKVCRSAGGATFPSMEVLGSFPVYSFFVPRPVWTVNGTVIEARPVYEQGRLVAFMMHGGTAFLKTGTKNTIKFSLPDQNASKIFFYDESRIGHGECYEFF